MQLSKFTDYAFRALIYLAKNSDEVATVDILADNLEISSHHLKKVIIIGAGPAGITAALELLRRGKNEYDVTVLD